MSRPMLVEALEGPVVLVYWRHMGIDHEEFDTVEEALEFVKDQEDRGEMWADNLFVEGKALYPERQRPAGSFPP